MNEYELNISLISDKEDGEKLKNFFGKQSENSKTIFDYWKWIDNLNQPFNIQIDIIIKRYIAFKDDNKIENIPKECLVVISNELQAKNLLKRMNDDIEEKDFMPLTLFLYKEEQFNIELEEKYPNIDPRTIFIENLANLNYYPDDSEYNPIQMILMRFCSIYNELGERFQIGEGDKLITYKLIKNSFPFYLNIFCLGKMRQGKSTTVNCILNELKARETEGGTSQTNKITYYEVENYPVKIYDLPGFQDEESINKAVEKMRELNKKINSLKQKFHIILYILDDTQTAKFLKKEFLIFRELLNHKEAKIIYILTHSGVYDEKEKKRRIGKIIKSMNTIIDSGIKAIKEKKDEKEEKKLSENELKILENDIKKKMEMTQENTVFVDYYKKDKKPNLGIHDLFKTINELFQKTESYIDRNLKVKQKGDTLKISAKNALKHNLIGTIALGFIPGVGGFAQDIFIKPTAIKEASEIFGLDYYKIVEEEKNLIEKHSQSAVTGIGTCLSISGFQQVSQNIPAVINNVDKTYLYGLIKWGKEAVVISPETTKFVTNSVLEGWLGIGSFFISAYLGYYFKSKEIDSIVNKLYEYYIKTTPSIGRSYEEAADYLEKMQNKYSEKTQTSK